MPGRTKQKNKMGTENRLQTRNAGKKNERLAGKRQVIKSAGAASFPYPADFLTPPSESAASRKAKSRNTEEARYLFHYRQG